MAAPSPSADEPDPRHLERLHEGVTMALYVSISLQAVVLATPILDVDRARVHVALNVFLTAVGLLLAHQVAFRMSSRLLNGGDLDESNLARLSAQGVGGLLVAVLATLPILVFGGAWGIRISEGVLLAMVLGVGYATARAAGRSRLRSTAYVVAVGVGVLGVLALKLTVGH